MDTSQLQLAMFVVCGLGIFAGLILGIVGIWLPNFGETGMKLFMTDIVITVAAGLVAMLTKWFWPSP